MTSKDELSKLPMTYFTGGDEKGMKSQIMTVQEVAAYYASVDSLFTIW